MVQVTARVTEELTAALNRWAGEEGVQRSDLIRNILTEAAEARQEGRASFQRPEMPEPADLARLVTRLDAQTTELERVLRQNAKRDAELSKRAQADRIGVSDARTGIVGDIEARTGGMLETFQAELVRTRDELTALLRRLPQLAGIDEKLDHILVEARKPRTSLNLGFGDWSWRKVAVVLPCVLVAGMGAFFALTVVLPGRWFGIPLADRMLGGGDQAICRLIDHQHDTGMTDCEVRVRDRLAIVRVNIPEKSGR